MKMLSKLCLILLFHLAVCSVDGAPTKKKAVTYEIKGRLGNHLVSYAHAKWLSYKYKLPLLFVPFEYSEHFTLHKVENFLYDQQKQHFKNIARYEFETDISTLPASTIIFVPFFRNEPDDSLNRKSLFPINWNDPDFKALMRDLLKPSHPIETIQLPKNRFNLLVHVRKGGGFDSPERQLDFPYKFPPDSFYIGAIKTLSKRLKNPEIYAYIMTDDPHPSAIVVKYKNALSNFPNIEFGYRMDTNGHSMNVLEDFFSIAKFDGCIRGDSTFTLMGAYLGDMKAVISPKKAHVEGDKIIVDEIDVKIRK